MWVCVCVFIFLGLGLLFGWANVAEILFKWIQAEILVNFYGKYAKLTKTKNIVCCLQVL